MLVKKTTASKFTFKLSPEERSTIFSAIFTVLENEQQGKSPKLINEYDVKREIYHSLLDGILIKQEFKMYFNGAIKWTLTRPEALSLMWLLRNHDNDISMLELKTQLHKHLTA